MEGNFTRKAHRSAVSWVQFIASRESKKPFHGQLIALSEALKPFHGQLIALSEALKSFQGQFIALSEALKSIQGQLIALSASLKPLGRQSIAVAAEANRIPDKGLDMPPQAASVEEIMLRREARLAGRLGAPRTPAQEAPPFRDFMIPHRGNVVFNAPMQSGVQLRICSCEWDCFRCFSRSPPPSGGSSIESATPCAFSITACAPRRFISLGFGDTSFTPLY